MKNKLVFIFAIGILVGTTLMFESCSPAKGESSGHEYMPDMGHQVAYEANHYSNYYYNSFDDKSVKSRKELSNPRMPISGTIPRGYAGLAGKDVEGTVAMLASLHGQTGNSAISMPINGHVNYYYGNTEEERARANTQIIKSPYSITAEGLEKGKELYNIYCGICHGESGTGNGYLVRDGGKYPAQPANLVGDEFIASSNGRFYHAIMYGKNVMGAYSEKLNYEERWRVIQYIRSLQAKAKSLVYNENENTLNANETPAAKMLSSTTKVAVEKEKPSKETIALPKTEVIHGDSKVGTKHK